MLNKRNMLALSALVLLASPALVASCFSLHPDIVPTVPMKSFSFRWYAAALMDTRLIGAFFIGVLVASASAMIACAVAWAGAHHEFVRKRAFANWAVFSAFLPCLMPPMVAGLALLGYYSLLGLRPGLHTLVFSHVAISAPLAFAIVRSGYGALDSDILGAASNLGASPTRSFLMVVLPGIRPSLMAALAASFLLSWSESSIAWFVGGFSHTLSTEIRVRMSSSITPAVYAAGVISVLLVLVPLLTFAYWHGGSRK
jgi:ABC-type spermidine/putrescine transport system permease subunit II